MTGPGHGEYRLPVRVPPIVMDSIELVAVVVAVAVLVALTLSGAGRARTCARWFLGLSVAGILVVTILAPSSGSETANLIPGRMIYDELARNPNHGLGVFNVLGNVVMFVPLGWLLAIAVPRRRVLLPIAAGIVLSMVIELTQAFIGRAPDIDDVILNGAGAAAGALIAALIIRMRSAIRRPPELSTGG